MQILGYIIAILLFLLLIVSHELGHFAAAKLFGVKVNEFSVGMGPLIFQRTKGETRYSMRAVPIGGYCAMEGEEDDSDDERALSKAAWWKQIIIYAAGATVNIIVAFLVMTCVYTYVGSYSPVLSGVNEGSPAALAGIKAGDKIVAVDGNYYDSWMDIVTAVNDSEGSEISITVKRGREELTFRLSPVYSEETGRYMCGFTGSIAHSFTAAMKSAADMCRSYFSSFKEFIVRLVTGRASGDEVVGVVGIVSAVGQSAQYGILNVVIFMAIISLNLGIVNLMPFPALDGGRILSTLIRVITRGRFTANMEKYLNAGGFVILMALMIFLIFKDTINLLK